MNAKSIIDYIQLEVLIIDEYVEALESIVEKYLELYKRKRKE